MNTIESVLTLSKTICSQEKDFFVHLYFRGGNNINRSEVQQGF